MVSAPAAGRYATDIEVLELLELTHRRDNPSTRLYRSKVNNRRNVYRWVVSRDAGRQAGPDGWIFCSWSQIGYSLYADVEVNNPDDGKRKSNSLRRMLDDLARARLLEWRPRTDDRGKFLGVMVRLLPVPSVPSFAPAGVAQSVRATGCGGRWQRARETREERRAACARGRHRRVGHGSRPLFFRSRDLASPPPGEPRNFVPGAPSHGCAHARASDASDAEPCRAPAPRNCGDEEERDRRREARRRRRREQRIARFEAETSRQLARGERMHRNELEHYAAIDGDAAAEQQTFGRFAALLASIPGAGGDE